MVKENGKPDQANNSHEIFIGDWCFKPDHCTLERGGNRIELRPKESDFLVYLTDHAGEVISHDDIITHVWHGVIVSEDSVYHAISQLRKAFSEEDSKEFIHTIPKRGYSLIASVRKENYSYKHDNTPPIISANRMGMMILFLSIIAIMLINL